MENYKNLDGDSTVMQYEIGNDYIIVKFSDGKYYKYSYASAGSVNVEQMKKLATYGEGLNSFIMKNVRKNYESSW